MTCEECARGIAEIEPGPAATAATARELLGMLRLLPDAMPIQPMVWVPRRCKQAASDILRSLLVQAVDHAQADAGDVEAELAHRLLW